MVTQYVSNVSSLGPSKHVNKYNKFSYIYTKQHRFIGQTQANNLHFHTKTSHYKSKDITMWKDLVLLICDKEAYFKHTL